jgi:tetratricopeptide (TPR) repeat protein
MRSADTLMRLPALFALLFVASGCATLEAPLKAIQDNVVAPVSKAVASVAAPSPAASASAPAPAAVAAAPAPAPRVEVPVAPAAQRAFDESLRALRAGRNEDAERGFRALTQSNPELGGPFANLGVLQRQAGKLDDSVKSLEQAVKASPDQPLYFNQLGISYRQQGQFTKARGAYEKAIALDPNYASAHLNLGILHDLYLRDNAKALEQYDRYIALAAGKDATVAKWVADLKNRKPQQSLLTKKEQP